MQYSVVNYKTVKENSDFRIDADYFEPRYQKLEKFLFNKKTTELNDFSNFIKKGIFDISPNSYIEEGGVAFLRSGDLKDEFISSDEIIQIQKESHEKEKKTELAKNDLLMAKVGTIGDVAINLRFERLNFSQNVMGVKIKKKYKLVSGFLLSFLNCSYGRNQVNRVLSGQVQQKLTLKDIKKVKIVNLEDQIQKLVSKIVYEAFLLKENSKNIYSQAEQLLISELGLMDWKPKHKLAFVKNFSATQEAERFDAEYFQPKYEEIIEAVKKYKGGFDIVKSQFEQNKKSFKKILDKEYQYIEIGSVNISDGSMEPMILCGDELPANAKIKLQKNDVIVSKVRPYRGAIGIVGNENYIGSGAFTVLQENGVVNKETLFVFLRLKPLLDFSLKFNTGTSYPTITDEDILNFPLPKIDSRIQEEIKKKITEMYETKKLSKFLLEIAKRGVEMAIEKDEQEAEKWINSEIKKLGK
ncbi:restriction endonuclease subunit S [Candidatus Wolfebacteria bacterium]|nr:restriction endonuclease subunit S [Candidatus Wolfebacteria bacterium]